MKLFDLDGKVALVTGGNGGSGPGMARGLAAAGAAIVIAARNREKAEAAIDRIAALGGKATFVELDVTEEASCHAAVDAAVAQGGRLDILVNNSGTTVRRQPESLT